MPLLRSRWSKSSSGTEGVQIDYCVRKITAGSQLSQMFSITEHWPEEPIRV